MSPDSAAALLRRRVTLPRTLPQSVLASAGQDPGTSCSADGSTQLPDSLGMKWSVSRPTVIQPWRERWARQGGPVRCPGPRSRPDGVSTGDSRYNADRRSNVRSSRRPRLSKHSPITRPIQEHSNHGRKAQGVSKATVQRIWFAHGLQPHRTKRFKLFKGQASLGTLRS